MLGSIVDFEAMTSRLRRWIDGEHSVVEGNVSQPAAGDVNPHAVGGDWLHLDAPGVQSQFERKPPQPLEGCFVYRGYVGEVLESGEILADIELGFGIWFYRQKLGLYGIQLPHARNEQRPLFVSAREWLEREVCNSPMVIRVRADRRAGRWLAELMTEVGESINDRMAKEGFAASVEYR